jgi:putative integral membrane protein (TIGR02587 family)
MTSAGQSSAVDTSEQAAPGPWRRELTDLVRAASGGLLFGAPLLYTMEVWWTGSHTSPEQVAAVLVLLTVPVFLLNQTEGFRTSRDVRVADAAADTVEAVAVGLVVTAGVLVLLREITVVDPLATDLGKVMYEAIPFCLGIGVARHFLLGSRDADDEGDESADGADSADDADAGSGGDAEADAGLSGTLADLGATTIGALFVSLSIAPTDEVPLISSTMTAPWLLLLMACSLAVSYAIVFVAGFSRQDQRNSQVGIFQRPLTETIVCYLIALVTAALLLWIFQRGLEPWNDLVTRVVVLGFPACIGGAAGRLAI